MTAMKIFIVFLALWALFTTRTNAQYITDYDGNEYDTISIGTQVWMKQNLKVTHYNDGTPIPNVSDSTAWAGLTSGARCYFNNDSVTFDSVYGALYNWYVATNPNICPSGWHISTNAEWLQVEIALGGDAVAGGEMKEAGTLHWLSPNTGATNNSGYTGLPGGLRDANSNYNYVSENGLWWTKSSYNTTLAWSTYLWYLNTGVDHNPTPKKMGLSIRCIKSSNTSLEEMNCFENIRIWPNPANEKIKIELPEYVQVSISIISYEGKIVLQHTPQNPNVELYISHLSAGMYVIHFQGQDQQKNFRFVKN